MFKMPKPVAWFWFAWAIFSIGALFHWVQTGTFLLKDLL